MDKCRARKLVHKRHHDNKIYLFIFNEKWYYQPSLSQLTTYLELQILSLTSVTDYLATGLTIKMLSLDIIGVVF